MKFGDASPRFLENLNALGFSPRTITGYGEDLAGFLAFLREVSRGEDIELALVSPLFVEAFLARGKRAPSYRNRKLSALRSFFRFAKKLGYIEENADPTRHVERARVPRKEPSHLTFEEYLSILEAAGRCSKPSVRLRNQAILVVLWNTGLRVSELTALNTAQFDGVRVVLVGIRRKGGRVLDLPLNANAVQAITVWLYARARLSLSPDGPLFVGTRKTRLSRRAVERMVVKCAAQAGLQKPVTPHTFRHSHCTELQRRGAAMETARQLMDHRRIETTARYSHSTDEAQRQAVAALEDPNIILLDTGGFPGVKTLLGGQDYREDRVRKGRPIPHWGTFEGVPTV